MATPCVDAPGVVVTAGDLKLPRSLALHEFLLSQLNPHAELVEVRRTGEGNEAIIFEVEVEVSQVRAFDIHPRERLAVIFRQEEELNPEVLALRKNFPYVPHLNPRDEEIPRSLCLYEESFDELRLTWTPANFVHQVDNALAAVRLDLDMHVAVGCDSAGIEPTEVVSACPKGNVTPVVSNFGLALSARSEGTYRINHGK